VNGRLDYSRSQAGRAPCGDTETKKPNEVVLKNIGIKIAKPLTVEGMEHMAEKF
jgi:hypothetical protein